MWRRGASVSNLGADWIDTTGLSEASFGYRAMEPVPATRPSSPAMIFVLSHAKHHWMRRTGAVANLPVLKQKHHPIKPLAFRG